MVAGGMLVRVVHGPLEDGAVNDTFNALVAARNDRHAVAALEPVVVAHAQDGSGYSRGLATVSCHGVILL